MQQQKQIVRGEIVLDSQIIQETFLADTSEYALVFDTETHTDISQHAKIVVYAIIKYTDNNPHNVTYLEKGMVSYNLTPEENERLVQFCTLQGYRYATKEQFINLRLFPLLEKGFLLANHNIPFDIGAIATDFCVDVESNLFRFKLCTCGHEGIDTRFFTHEKITISCEKHPTIVVKPVKTKKYVMYVERDNYGAIVDTITLGNAMLGNGASSLNAMVSRYGLEDEKEHVTDYSSEYTEEMYSYAMHDVELTCKLLISIYQLYKKHGLEKPFHTIMSEASVGKAYNEKLGIPPFRTAHNEVKPFLYTLANIAYYGGRSEAHIRKVPTLVRYCDFKSQYPMVNALLRSQDYLLAEYLTTERCVDYVQDFLDKLQFDDLREKKTWSLLPVLCKVETSGDILPCKIRQRLETGIETSVYGTQILDGTTSWYSLCDVVASYIRTGKKPKIVDAYRLIPHGKIQTNIVQLFGDDSYTVDVSQDDFFAKVIDLRDGVKAEIKQLKKQLKDTPNDVEVLQRKKYLDNLQLALKLMANSTSYGILVETREYQKQDIAGKYNAQPIGVHITSGSRLLLAIAEKLGLERGIQHCFCDTDSFAYAKPDDMTVEDFYMKVQECINWFNTLSPFASSDAVFELEEYNYHEGKDTPLYAYAISAKRYVLYNKLDNGMYRIRKLSEHGLVRYQFDIDIETPLDMTPIPTDYTGRRQWYPDRYCMWYRGIELAEKQEIPYLPSEVWSNQIAIKQETISTPRKYNALREIPDIRPFCFFTITPYSNVDSKRDRYYMSYCRNGSIVTKLTQEAKVKIVGTNRVVSSPVFDTLLDRFQDFFEHAETKSENGNTNGTMQRKIITKAIVEARTRSGKKTDNTTIE